MKTVFFGAMRWLAAGLVAVFLWSLCAAAPLSSADPDAVWQAVTGAADLTHMQEGSNAMIRRLYGIDPSDYEACYLYYPASNMDADELLLVKLTDPAQSEALAQAAQARLATQKASFDGYGVAQYDLLTHHAAVEPAGNYFLLAVTANDAAVLAAFHSAL